MSSDLVVERRSPMPVSPEAVFGWHARPGSLERLVPPWMNLSVRERIGEGVEPGSRVRFRVSLLGPIGYEAVHQHVDTAPPHGFSDVQIRGPFDRWIHHHRFEPDPRSPGQALLVDRIECSLAFGLRLGRNRVRRDLERMLTYRHAVTALDLAMQARTPGRSLHIAVTGASGLLGSALIPVLTTAGHRVTRMVRRAAGPGELQWQDHRGFTLQAPDLDGIDAVVNLAGENLAQRWTESVKREIRESRVAGTRHLARVMAEARSQGGPDTLISASAVGYYGDREDEILTESSPPGTGFLPEVAEEWEQATQPAEAAGVRVVRLRTGMPLTPAGGFLGSVLLPFRLGLGGRLGSGSHWMSPLSIDDWVEMVYRSVLEPFAGPVNAVGPEPIRNGEFTRLLGRVLQRPALLVVPRFAIRLRFGQMADEAVFTSTRALPVVMREAGHAFRHPTVEQALRHELGL